MSEQFILDVLECFCCHSDTYATFIKQLQSMASSRLRHVGAPELRRAAAMVVVMECAVDIAGCTPDMMRVEGSNGEGSNGEGRDLGGA